MSKIFTVAITEYVTAVRSKAFIIGLIMLPVLMSGGFVVTALTRNKVDIRDRRFAVVDRSGRFFPVIEAKAEERNRQEIFDRSGGIKGKQIRPGFKPELFRAKPGEENKADEVILSERVRSKELFAFVILGDNLAASNSDQSGGVAYHTETPTYEELPSWLERVINDEVQRSRFEKANIDRDLVKKLTQGTPFKRLGLAQVSQTGEVIKAKEENRALTFAIPMVSMFLLYMLIMSSAPALLNTVLEEKMQKISEVLISTIPPFQLMMGKLLGAMMVSLTLSVLYVGGASFFLFKSGWGQLVPLSHFGWFFLFQILALMIFGSIFSAIGAACSEIKDAQSMMLPAMMIVMLPFFTWMPVIQSPSSTFSRVISLFPPATPMLMMLRIGIKPGPPLWEIILAVMLTTVFMLLCVWAAAKIFRIGILSQGQSPSFRKMLSWIWSS